MTEIWKDLSPDVWGTVYEISNLGNLRNKRNGKLLKPKSTKGHPYPNTTLTIGKLRKKVKIHILVITAFRGDKQNPRHECCHADDNPENNVLSNLRWGTRKENLQDQMRNGLTRRKLTEKQVSEIRHLGKDINPYKISKLFNVSHITIKRILRGETYYNV